MVNKKSKKLKVTKKVPRKRSNPKVYDKKTMSLRMAKRTWSTRPKGRPAKALKQKLTVAKQVLKAHGYTIKRGVLVSKADANKGRGRPRKLTKTTKPKRSRGRPRTKPKSDKPKRSRGRPPKAKAKGKKKRGRGRPKNVEELQPKIRRRKRLPPKKKR